jgi:hypothetical protein
MPPVATILAALVTFVTHARPDLTHLAMHMMVRGMVAPDAVTFVASELNRVDAALLVAEGRPLRALLDSAPLYNILRRFLTVGVVTRMLVLASLANNGALVEDRLTMAKRYRAAAR